MSVRPLDGAGRKWQIDFYPQGRKGPRERLTFYGTLDEARRHEAELRQAHDLPAPLVAETRLIDILPAFRDHYRIDRLPRTVGDMETALKRLLPAFGHLPLSRITDTIVEQYMARRLEDGVKKRTINRELCYLSVILKWAADKGHCRPVRVKRFPKKHTRPPTPNVPTMEEVQAVLSALHPSKRGLFMLMYDAGLRKTEAFTLRGLQVDLARGTICILGKGGKERIQTIDTHRLHAELAAAKARAGNGLLYPNPWTGQPLKDIREALRRAIRKSGIGRHIYPHLLRHGSCTHSVESGVELTAIQKGKGHADISTTMIYVNIAAEHQKREGRKFGQRIDQLDQAAKAASDNARLINFITRRHARRKP